MHTVYNSTLKAESGLGTRLVHCYIIHDIVYMIHISVKSSCYTVYNPYVSILRKSVVQFQNCASACAFINCLRIIDGFNNAQRNFENARNIICIIYNVHVDQVHYYYTQLILNV